MKTFEEIKGERHATELLLSVTNVMYQIPGQRTELEEVAANLRKQVQERTKEGIALEHCRGITNILDKVEALLP